MLLHTVSQLLCRLGINRPLTNDIDPYSECEYVEFCTDDYVEVLLCAAHMNHVVVAQVAEHEWTVTFFGTEAGVTFI